jgi:hypothetical protein
LEEALVSFRFAVHAREEIRRDTIVGDRRGLARGAAGRGRNTHDPRQPRLRRRGDDRRFMRKLLLTLLLPFVFLLSQQGAVTHELSHLTDVLSFSFQIPAN